MTQIMPVKMRSVDLVRVGPYRASSAIVSAAATRARLLLREHDVDYPEAAVGVRFTGDVVMAEVPAIDSAVLLMLADIRRRATVRLILIATEATMEQRILALTLGTDHVLEAPIDERELAAMLRNATRNPSPIRAEPRSGEEHRYWHLETDRWVLIAPNLREVRLTRSEYVVLGLLLDGAGRIRTRPELLAGMNGSAERERVLDVLLSKLRRKVRDIAQLELPLRSARNAGYVFAGGVRRQAEAIGRVTAATPH